MNSGTKRENSELRKLEIGDTIRKTFTVYKTGFKQYMALSLISIITNASLGVFEAVIRFSLPIGLLILLFAVISIYPCLRANASVFFLTQSIFREENSTFKESFKRSNGFAGTYFVVALMFGFIVALPCIGIALSYEFINNHFVKFGLIGLLAVPLAFLLARYYLALPSAMLGGQNSGDFEKSKILVRGSFLQVFVVIIITYGVITGASQLLAKLPELFKISWMLVFAAVVNIAFGILTAPISNIAAAVMYLTLNDIKRFDQSKKKLVVADYYERTDPNESKEISLNITEGTELIDREENDSNKDREIE